MQRIKKFIYRHIMFIAGGFIGLIIHLGLFGLIVGSIIGYLLDEVLYLLLLRKKIKSILCTGLGTTGNERDFNSIFLISYLIIFLSTNHTSSASSRKEPLQHYISAHFNLNVTHKFIISEIFKNFDQGSKDHIGQICNHYITISSETERTAILLFLFQFWFDYLKNKSYEKQIEKLQLISQMLDIPHEVFNTVYRQYVVDKNDAYEILGISPEIDNQELKKIYRKLVTDFHPDNSHNLSQSQKEMMHEAFIKIQDAFEKIKKERAF